MEGFVLRDYQEDWVYEIGRAFKQGTRRVLAVLPTGGGKTVCFSRICAGAAAKGNRVVLLGHRIEICRQISEALKREGVVHGFIGPERLTRNQNEPVVVAMINTLTRRLSAIEEPRLLIIDEAHHATSGTYKRISENWSQSLVLGVTATPRRTDGRGLNECFDTMVLGPDMPELVLRKYLSKFTCFSPPKLVDLSKVRVRAGDYVINELVPAVDKVVITGDAIKHYKKHLDGRPAIAFCASVEHAANVAQQFRDAGWNAKSVDGKMTLRERQDRIAAIGDGRLNVLTSCDVISEGTDIPVVAGAILLRPTKSLIVHLQQCGRVLRPKPDGTAAVILDHVGNILSHGLPDEDRNWSLDGKAKAPSTPPPVRECPSCYCAHRPAAACPACGYVFPIKKKPRAVAKDELDSELEEMTPERIRAIKNAELRDILRFAKTEKELRLVARIRGYDWRWVSHIIGARRRRSQWATGRAA